MKITSVEANMRRRAFVIGTSRGEFSFPFAKLRLQPTADDPIQEAFADPELGKEAVTYRLASGAEGTIHLDSVREFARDPDYLHELLVHQLTVAAINGLAQSGLGMRQVARHLGTSASQLYRLLDPDNRKKSIGQMLALLHLVDRDVELVVTERIPGSSAIPQGVSMAHKKVTKKKAASAASKTLKSKSAGVKSKSAAGSALSQRKAPRKATGKKAATAASKTLRDGRTSKASKSAAGSALSQKHGTSGSSTRRTGHRR